MSLISYIFGMKFITFLCDTLKIFSLSFVPLLAPNPGDATANYYAKQGSSYYWLIDHCQPLTLPAWIDSQLVKAELWL